MGQHAVEFNGVWKKFKRGERFDSLRDLIPSMVKKALSSRSQDELDAKEFWALRDVSFQLERGEAIATEYRHASSSGHNQAAPRTPLESPWTGGANRVSTRSEITEAGQCRGTM